MRHNVVVMSKNMALGRIGVVAASVLSVGLLASCGTEGSEASPSDSAAPSSSPAAVGGSVCGFQTSEEMDLQAAPESEWEKIGDMDVPTAPSTVGPGVVDDDGLRSCFAQSPEGALYATANAFAAVGNGSAEGVYRELSADGPMRDKELKELDERTEQEKESTGNIQYVGFNIVSYTPDAAIVELVMNTHDGQIGAVSFPMVWEDGDWKTDLDDEANSSIRMVDDPETYIAWSAGS